MKNFVQPGRTLTLTAPTVVQSGEGVLIGAIFGIASGDAAMGEDVDIVTEGVFTLPKVPTDVLSVGERVYWDGDEVGEESTSSIFIGVAVKAAGNGATSVQVRLNPSFA